MQNLSIEHSLNFLSKKFAPKDEYWWKDGSSFVIKEM